VAIGLTELLGTEGRHTAEEWLRKTGLFSEEATESFGKMVEDGTIVDAYRTLAKELTDEKIANAVEDSIKANEEDKEDNKNKYGSKGLRETTKAIQKLTGELTDEKGEVSDEARSLLKPPFMTFQYGAGFKKNIQELSDVLIEKYEGLIGDAWDGKEFSEDIKEFLEAFGITDMRGFHGYIMENSMESYELEGGTTFGEALRNTVKDSYGIVITEVLTKEFEHVIEVNRVVNSSMKAVFSVRNRLFMEKLEKLSKEGEVSKDNIEGIFADEEMRKLFPVIEGPLSDGPFDGIAIFKRKLLSTIFEDGELGNKFGNAAAFTYKNGAPSEVSLNSVRRGLAEAGAAGAVIPIHTLDAAIMGQIAAKYGVLSVHDAIVMGLATAEDIVREYNERVFNISRDWNYLAEVHKTLKRVLGSKEAMDHMQEIVDANEDDLGELLSNSNPY